MESIKKNIVYQVIYQILTIILPIITAPYVARVIGAEGVGIYSYTYSIAYYFVLFSKFGIHVYGNRTIATVRDDKDKLNKTFSDLFFVHGIFSAIVIIFYIVYIILVPSSYKLIVIVQAFYVIAGFLDINWLYFGLEKFKITVSRNMIIKLMTVVAIFIFVKNPEDVHVYCFILAFGTFVSESVVWFFLPKYIKFVKPNWNNAKKHIIPLFSFFIPSIAVSLYKVMDKIMLGILSSTIEVGLYENSEKIINIVLGMVTAVGTVMMPRMANLSAKGDKKESRKMMDMSMKYILILTLAMAFGISGVATVFAPVFFGDEFASCNILMMGLAISMPFTAFANVLRTQYLIPNHKDVAFQSSVMVGAVVNIVVNYMLIPHIQALGAVIGTILAEASVCMIQIAFSVKEVPVSKYLKEVIVPIVVGLIMYLVVAKIGFILGPNIATLIIQVLVGIVIYLVLMGTYLFLSKDELYYMIKEKVAKKQ